MSWINADTRDFMSKGYLGEGESVEQRINTIARVFEYRLKKTPLVEAAYEFAKSFEHHLLAGNFSLSSPIWANYGKERGLPISCNGSYIPDSVSGMKAKDAEIAMMSKHGAGTSAYLGDVRPRGSSISGGSVADGVLLPASMLQSTVNLISQGGVRRGSIAVYYPIEGDDFWEFISFRRLGSFIQDISLGVTVTDAFMESLEKRDVENNKRWAAVLKKRFETGYPYIFWVDTANREKPSCYEGEKIYASNLCQEICLPSNEEESFVCCLMSMNLERFDEWKDTDAVHIATIFLDTVMQEYIDKTNDIPFMEAANRFARRHRALGIGTLGYHSYLQKKGYPFESFQARAANIRMHRHIQEESLKASEWLGEMLGTPEGRLRLERRNTTLMAIAPTTSSSFILGQVSPGIEPLVSNYFTKNLSKGMYTYRNPYLKKVLQDLNRDDEGTWKSILEHGGSVQHLDFLSITDKEVFKTFSEISPLEIIRQAGARQVFIDQGQSLNLLIHPEAPLKDVNALMFEAWRLGVKGLYYQRGTNPVQEATKNIMQCSACEA